MDTNTKSIASTPVPLRDSLLRDTLTRAVENDMETFQLVLENITRYVDIVHHSQYSPDLMQCEPCEFFGIVYSLTVVKS